MPPAPSTTPLTKPQEHAFESSLLFRIKQRLQFTGWLQYLPNLVAVLLMLILGGIGALVGAWPALLVGLPLGLAALLFSNLVFDVATVRWGLHPSEPLPRRGTELDAFALMRARYACRSFQRRAITPEHLAELKEVAETWAGPGRRLGEKPIRFEYLEAPLTVWPVVGAHEFFVAIAPKEYDRRAVVDVGRSLHRVVLHATRMGLATCWIGPGADQKSVIEHLGDRFDPERDHVICVCALGYASRYRPLTLRLMQWGQRHRLPLSQLFFVDPKGQEPLPTTAPPFDAYGRCYEVCQWSPSSYNSQTTRCVAVTKTVDGEEVIERFDFGSANASRYYAAVAVGIWLANWETGCEALGLRGRFVLLPPEARGEEGSVLVKHDVSWIPEGSPTAP